VNVERFVRKRFARVGLAVFLVGTAGWAFLPYVTHRVAASAFVNSELVRVTAPFAGRVSASLPRKGDLIERPTALNLVEALTPDRRHLLDLQLQHALAKEAGDLARRQLKEIATFDAELAKRSEAYRLAVVDQVRHEAIEAEAETTGCLAELKQRNEIGLRMTTLTETGVVSPIRSAEARASQEVASTHCAMAAARVDRLQVELSAAERGIFLSGGANDVSYSQQQRDHLLLRQQELEMRALQETARASQLAAEIEAERDRLERLDKYRPVLPARHVVWSTGASPGSAVTEGQAVLDLADCEHRFVVVQLPERDFEKIKAGDRAAVRLVGSTEWREGLVQQIRGSAARNDERLFAAQIPSPGPATITAEVSLPSDDVHADGASYCGIGRLAEVRLRRSPFDLAFIEAIWHRLTAAWETPTRSSVAASS
jgi:multidrug resistance efflux pump